MASAGDLAHLTELAQCHVSIDAVWSRAEKLMLTPTYRRIQIEIESALLENLVVTGAEVARLTERFAHGTAT